ncbi:MAG: metallophosphoesterase [Quinella sp. 1Q5]|nr:metallophosphoesterase [Quinella sp. 1Q5]
MNRRTFIKVAAASALALITGCGGDKKFLYVKHLRQVVTKNINRSRRIMWQVEELLTNPAVEVSSGKIFPAQNATFTDDGKEIIQYTAQIDFADRYRIIDGEAATDWHDLKTVSDKCKAIIFPDSQCGGGYETWGTVACGAFERNPDANFFVNVGDLVDNGEDNAQWEDWLAQVEEYLPQVPFVPVMGNHETYSRAWEVRLPVSYLNYFAPPDNGFEEFSRRFYSFDVGAVHVAVLDSQWDELGKEVIDVQKDWLRNDMKTDKPWKIAFIHKDVLQYRINGRPERLEGFSDVGELFMLEFESLGVDVVFTGHLHTYRNRGLIKGTLYILTGLSGNVRYDRLWINHALDKFVAPQPETDNYLTLEVDDKTLSVKCFLPNGELLDETTLHKA